MTNPVLVVLAFVVVVSAIALIILFLRADRSSTDATDAGNGPTGTDYPAGSRPAGPGAEAVGVGDPGDPVPGPADADLHRPPSVAPPPRTGGASHPDH